MLAAGARNSLHERFCGRLGPENFMVAAGYYIPGSHHTVQIKFLEGLHGYIWIFPRTDHFSAGICGRMNGTTLRRAPYDLGATLSKRQAEFDRGLAELPDNIIRLVLKARLGRLPMGAGRHVPQIPETAVLAPAATPLTTAPSHNCRC